MKIVAVIPHTPWVPERRAWAREIHRALRPGEAYNVHDIGTGYGATYMRAWRYGAAAYEVTHVLLIEDDHLPCRNFRDLMYSAVEEYPDACVNLYCTRPRVVAAAQSAGTAWVEQDDNVCGATVLPVAAVRDFIRWERRACRSEYEGSDRKAVAYCWTHDIPVLTTVPSLTDHVGARSSLIGHSGARFRDTILLSDGSPVDWTTAPIKLPRVVDRESLLREVVRIDARREASPA